MRARMAHVPAYSKSVSGLCKPCSKPDARRADTVVSSVIMIQPHTTLSLLDCRTVCQDRNRMVKKFVVPVQQLLQPEGTLPSSIVFVVSESASWVPSCCLLAVPTCSCATRLTALACGAPNCPVAAVKVLLICYGMPRSMQCGRSALACMAAYVYITSESSQNGKIFLMCSIVSHLLNSSCSSIADACPEWEVFRHVRKP